MIDVSSVRSRSGIEEPRIVQFFVIAYLILKPIYLWSSGLPQVADVFLVILIAHSGASGVVYGFRGVANTVFSQFAVAFAYWTTLVNIVAAFFVGDLIFIRSALMNVYNIAAALTLLYLLVSFRATVLRAIFVGSVLSSSLQALILIGGLGRESSRPSAFLNNPNQLGYFGLLVACLLVASFIGQQKTISVALLLTGLTGATVCVIYSISRSAMAGLIILLVGLALWPPGSKTLRQTLRRYVIILAGAAAVLLTLIDSLYDTRVGALLADRVGRGGMESFDSVRGYDRVGESPEYWLFGAGEGVSERFGAITEVHSTFGNVQLSYGLVGTVLLLLVLIASLPKGSIAFAYVLLAPLSYGLAHNGIRHTLFWMLLAIFAAGVENRSAFRADPTPGLSSANGVEKAT